ncbi:immunity 22 family protein [Longispora sp. NPDC051575]|uniref:immunity 22 family protein n=1 Tax=Longispora sp. NPDC051575 TaxID=3154943 RepID=UPI0034330CF0
MTKAGRRIRKIHVWIGVREGTDDDWFRYFDVEGAGAACGFCRDTGMTWFDFDFFSAYFAGEVVDVEHVTGEVAYSEQFDAALGAACEEHGVRQADACFTLIDFDGATHVGRRYHGLTLVGVFEFSA